MKSPADMQLIECIFKAALPVSEDAGYFEYSLVHGVSLQERAVRTICNILKCEITNYRNLIFDVCYLDALYFFSLTV